MYKRQEFDNLAAAIDDSAGAMQNMADTQLDNLQGDITIMKSAPVSYTPLDVSKRQPLISADADA